MSRFDFLSLNAIDPQNEFNTEDYTVGVGGLVFRAKAAAALNVGDVVYWSTGTAVNKSTSAGLTITAGVVVGGSSLDAGRVLTAHQRTGDIGLQAAPSGGVVLVCKIGIIRVVADTSTILVGSQLKQSGVTAGRVALATTGITATQTGSTINSGGTGVTSTAANGAIITDGAITVVGDSVGTVIGRAITASSVAGTVIYAAINVV